MHWHKFHSIDVRTHTHIWLTLSLSCLQVHAHISQMLMPLSRISFIGHSLGGIITRACLAQPIMAQYRPKLHTYCSLGSAHLGYQYSDNRSALNLVTPTRTRDRLFVHASDVRSVTQQTHMCAGQRSKSRPRRSTVRKNDIQARGYPGFLILPARA